MKILILLNFVSLSILKEDSKNNDLKDIKEDSKNNDLKDIKEDLKNQIELVLSDKLKTKDYVSIDLDEDYVVHVLNLNRFHLSIEEYTKSEGLRRKIRISLKDYLDDDLNLREDLKYRIIKELCSYKNSENNSTYHKKYLSMQDGSDLYKNEIFIWNFINNLSEYTSDLQYDFIMRNNYVFESLYNNKERISYYNYIENSDSLIYCLSYGYTKKYIFTVNSDLFDNTKFLGYYYSKTNIEKDFLKDIINFTRYFNLSSGVIDKEISLSSESSCRVVDDQCIKSDPQLVFDTIYEVSLNREIDIVFTDSACYWDSLVCFYTRNIDESDHTYDDSLRYYKINKVQLEECKKFYNECMTIKLEDLEYKIRLMNLIKDTKLYRNILENILRPNDTARRIILISILQNLAIISREEYEYLLFNPELYNRYEENISKIMKEINSHTQNTFYGIYNMILYNEIENMENEARSEEKDSFFKDLIKICQIPYISKLINLDKENMMGNLRIFVEKVLYRPSKLEDEESDEFYALVAQVIEELEFDQIFTGIGP
jgi:hypothetical protein